MKDSELLNDIHHLPYSVKYMPMFLSFVAVLVGLVLYVKYVKLPGKLSRMFAPIYKLSYNKFYIDEAYNFLIVSPLKRVAGVCYIFDNSVIDGLAVEGSARNVGRLARICSKIYTGVVGNYAVMIMLAVMASIFILSMLVIF